MNIAEIAKLAGVSSAAVSRYFNNGYISEEKREAIRAVVEETGYRPSVQAQTLRTKKTKAIGVIVPKIASASIGKIVEGVLSVLNQSGYQMLLAVTQNNPEKELEYLEALNDKQVDGVILAATIFTDEHKQVLEKMKVPVVIVGQNLSGYCCVYHDDYHAIYEMTRTFLEQGRNRLGYIGVLHQDRAAGLERYHGYSRAVVEMGYEEMADCYVTADFTYESGYEKAKELLEKNPKLNGIICATDTIAAGAMQYIQEQGIQMPEQIRLSGLGDSVIARMSNPPMATIQYSYEKSGEMAVEMLLDLLTKKKAEVKKVVLGYSLVRV